MGVGPALVDVAVPSGETTQTLSPAGSPILRPLRVCLSEHADPRRIVSGTGGSTWARCPCASPVRPPRMLCRKDVEEPTPESLILRGPSGFDLLGKSTELKRQEAKPHAFCPQQQTPHAPPTVDEFKGVVSQRSSGSTLGLLVCRRDAGWTPADAPQVLAVDGLLTLELELNLIGKVLPDDRADVVPESGARVVLAGSVLRGTRRPKSESMPIGLVCTVPPVALFSGPGDFCSFALALAATKLTVSNYSQEFAFGASINPQHS